jgi:hypothetical protein
LIHCQKIVLKGVGVAIIKPKAIGTLQGRNELKRQTQGINSPVSGWIAVDTTVCALLRFLISSFERRTKRVPVLACASSSLFF